MANGIKMGRRPDLVGGGVVRSIGGWECLKTQRSLGNRIKGDERILGSSDFVQRVLQKADESYEQKSQMAVKGLDLQSLMEMISRYYQIDSEELQTPSKARTVARARALFCYLAVVRLRNSCVQIGRFLNVSPSTVSKAVNTGRNASERRAIEEILQERSRN